MKRSNFHQVKRIRKAKKGESPAPAKKLTVELMSSLLCDSTGFVLRVTTFCPYRCTCIIKALVSFVANNPPSVATNLFKADQVSNVNPYQVFEMDLPTRKARNWQYVFATVNYFIDKPCPGGCNEKDKQLVIASQKSCAAIIGELTSNYQYGGLNTGYLMGLVIAYWVAKLYSVSIYRADPMDLPAPFPEAYKMFIQWKGDNWNGGVPCLRFEDDDLLWKEGQISSCFPFAQECVSKERLQTRENEDDWVPDEFLMQMCQRLGVDKISTYCSGFKGSLLDFYLETFQLTAIKNTVLGKISRICENLMSEVKDELPFEDTLSMTLKNMKLKNENVEETAEQNVQGCSKNSDNPSINQATLRPNYSETNTKASEWKIPSKKS